MLVAQLRLTLCDPMDCSPPGSSLSMGLSRQEYQSELPFPSQGDFPDPKDRTQVSLQHCRQILYHLSHQGEQKRRGAEDKERKTRATLVLDVSD